MFMFLGFLLFLGIHNVSNACTETGRFPNNSEAECRGFTMCLKGAAGFMQYNLVCPEHSVYSHIDNQCTNITEYKCWPNYNCTKEEDIIEPSNENCTTYISCVKDLNDIFMARLVECPENMAYNGSACVSKDYFQCPQKPKPTTTVQVTIDNLAGNVTLNNSAISSSIDILYLSLTSLLCVIVL